LQCLGFSARNLSAVVAVYMTRDIDTVDSGFSVSNRGGAFLSGLAAPWRGFRHMWRHPALWRYGVIPVLLNLIINILLLLGLVAMTVGMTTWFHTRFQEMEYGVAWEILAVVGMVILALGVTIAAWKLLEGIFCGYYYGKLAAAVEVQLGMPPGEMQGIPFSSQLTGALRDFGLLVTINLACLMLNCIPVVGPIVAVTAALYFDASILGRNYLDFPLSLRGWTDKDKRDFFRSHRFSCLGLGIVALVFNLLPIVGAVVLTTATTGAVLLNRRLEGTLHQE
jgi:CysZ protein